jgi:diguanylate cyclase (GGDEF)-like protein
VTGGPRPPGVPHWPARIAFVAAAVALVAVVLLLDVLTPLGAAVDGLYAIAVLVSALARLPRFSLAIVLAASMLVLSGLAFSRDAQVPWQIVVINRAVALVLVWVTYLLIQRIERARAALEQRDRELAERNARLARLATEDPLTGVANRRRFDAQLPVEVARAQREQRPLVLLMIDIDRFKEYNDRRGHPAGDECLIRVAQALAAQLHRPSDLVARIGGEEFAVLLPNTEAGGAGEHAERIRAAVESLALAHPGGGVVTVSIGVAVTSGLAGPQGPDELLAFADRALYRAKDAGRNLVAV